MPLFLRYTGYARPEDRALLRSNPSAVPGPKAKLGGIAPPGFYLLQLLPQLRFWRNAINLGGLGGLVPHSGKYCL